jgi:predicted esterase
VRSKTRRFVWVSLTLVTAVTLGVSGFAQQSPVGGRGPGQGGRGGGPANGPRPPMTIAPDPRVQQRTYDFTATEKLTYVRYVSSKVSKDKKAPLIVALHGLGGDGNFLVRDRLVDLAEEGGYVVVGPLGYNVSGWYGSPVINLGNGPVEPANLTELSEKDVMNVLAMTRKEFAIDDSRTYLMGHSMGGAGTLFLGQKHASNWAAIAAIAPAAFMLQRNMAETLTPLKKAGMPVIVVQGDADTVVPPTNTRQWIEGLKQSGIEHKYIEIPGGDHGTVIKDGMPDIFRFFAEHVRKP